MDASEITRSNIAQAVDETLDECLVCIGEERDGFVIRDLTVAIQALRGIRSDIQGEVPQRPKGLRSGWFIRYAIDANDKLAIDPVLKEKVVRIEDIYKRV